MSSLIVEPTGFLAGKTESDNTGYGRRDNRDLRRPRGNERKLHCSYCEGDGHVKEQCFEPIGYPDWFRGKRGRKIPKVAAQANVDRHSNTEMGDTPLEASPSSSVSVDSSIHKQMLQPLCQEVMRAFKGKAAMDASSGISIYSNKSTSLPLMSLAG